MEIDPTNYVRPPKFDVASAVTVGLALITAMPKPAPDHVRAAATRVRTDTVALQLAWGKSGVAAVTRDRRKADNRIDTAWGGLLDRLESCSRLPLEIYPRAARARNPVRAAHALLLVVATERVTVLRKATSVHVGGDDHARVAPQRRR